MRRSHWPWSHAPHPDLVGETGGAVDGITELWYNSERDLLDAYAPEHGQRVAADSLAHVGSRTRLIVTEHCVVG